MTDQERELVCVLQAGLARLSTSAAWRRGRIDCIQDGCENAPFACIGGLGARSVPRAPTWVPELDRADWLAGYLAAAEANYGADWRTCSFEWRPALTIGGDA